MRVSTAELRGVRLAPAHRHEDGRGTFTKLMDSQFNVQQVCVSENAVAGTLRGLHVQADAAPETKRLWCSRGRIFDVLVDTRRQQKTFGSWAGLELDSANPQVLTIPPGVAHGFITLTDGSAITYLIDGRYAPEFAKTIRWDDPFLAIEWPREVVQISKQDAAGEIWTEFS